jgi:small subunit ribosomal protein S17
MADDETTDETAASAAEAEVAAEVKPKRTRAPKAKAVAEEAAPAEDAAPAEEAAAVEAVAEVTDAPAEEEAAAPAPAPKTRKAPAKTAKAAAKPAARKVAKKPAREAKERGTYVRTPAEPGTPGVRKERRGVVVSSKGDKTITVRVDVMMAHPKYKKIMRRSVKLRAHDEQNSAGLGDVVRIVECRPLSKTKRWRLIEIVEVAQ